MRWTWLLALTLLAPSARADDRGLIGHWKFAGNADDASGHGRHGRAVAVDLSAPGPDGAPRGAARFDGKTSFVEVPADAGLELGRGDFSLAVWAHTDESLDDIIGDLVSKYDPVARRGLNWCIKSGAGATNSQANERNVQFGIVAGTEPAWTDLGRPGNAVYVMAMVVHDSKLFVGTCEAGPGETGHVYRYEGGSRWVDCGSPDRCNAVTSLATFNGRLYAGTGRYRLAGSSLPESPNAELGGKIARYDGDGLWADCGRLPDTEAVGGMAVFRGELYASSLYRPAGFFRYRGGNAWQRLPLPPDGRRVVPLGIFNGHLYAGSYDSCTVARFDGEAWETFPALEESGQTYSFEVHRGKLHVGTWPNGRVFRFEDGGRWVDAGRLGEEKEVMGMAVHNGKLYAGTLPLAEVYRLDDSNWTLTGRLDRTPDVRYRRAWSMAVFDGRHFCGTLPSGRVHALEAGQSVTLDRPLRPGWRHLAAVREDRRLSLYVDGALVASSSTGPEAPLLDLTNGAPLRIGSGPYDYFRGSLSDLRLYNRAISAEEIAVLAVAPTPAPVPFTTELRTILEHDDGRFLWYHPRATAIPATGGAADPEVLVTIQKHLRTSDHYSGLSVLTTPDLGRTWAGPEPVAELDWVREPGVVDIAVVDVTPMYHPQSGKVLAVGAQVRYSPQGEQLEDRPRSHQTAYAVYDPKSRRWTSWRRLEMPPEASFNFARSACAQFLIEPDGSVLLPFYIAESADVPFSVTVARCTFDGHTLTYREHGDVLALDVVRGLCEPSLARVGGRYFLTIRNDLKGYVTASDDGLRFRPIKPWSFDDGEELGSYNTQQHWLTHADALFLVYTRRGAGNDHIMRHRAPLFIAQVDPWRLHVIRSTERVLVPERGAELGNFGAAQISGRESWVTVAEGVWDDEARRRGAKGAVFVARIIWRETAPDRD